MKTFLIPAGVSPFQSGPTKGSYQLGPGGAAADIAVVVGVAVDQLYRVVAFLFHGRNRDHHRLGTQVQPAMEYGVSLFGVMTAVSL